MTPISRQAELRHSDDPFLRYSAIDSTMFVREQRRDGIILIPSGRAIRTWLPVAIYGLALTVLSLIAFVPGCAETILAVYRGL